ncbi:MAG: DUF6364 family protein [Egibacteraceae bacterium]
MPNRNVTVTLPESLLRRARVVAAQRDTSVSSLVAQLLTDLVQAEDDYDQLWREEQRLMAQGLPMRIGRITWSRDELHAR